MCWWWMRSPGDAIPVHLLTAEAMTLYRSHLAQGGVIAFHVSNQYLDLAPVVGRLAEANGMEAQEVHTAANEARGEMQAAWVLVSARRSSSSAGGGAGAFRWRLRDAVDR